MQFLSVLDLCNRPEVGQLAEEDVDTEVVLLVVVCIVADTGLMAEEYSDVDFVVLKWLEVHPLLVKGMAVGQTERRVSSSLAELECCSDYHWHNASYSSLGMPYFNFVSLILIDYLLL